MLSIFSKILPVIRIGERVPVFKVQALLVFIDCQTDQLSHDSTACRWVSEHQKVYSPWDLVPCTQAVVLPKLGGQPLRVKLFNLGKSLFPGISYLLLVWGTCSIHQFNVDNRIICCLHLYSQRCRHG